MKKLSVLLALTFTLAASGLKAQNCFADFQYWTNGLSVNFQDSSSFNQSINYSWSFGDGSGFSSMMNPNHTYANAGTYNVCLYIWNQLCSDTICRMVTVTGTPPPPPNCNASFTVAKDSSAPFKVIIYNTSTNAASYSWDFGDGTTGSGRTPLHQYQNFGSYNVCLTIADSAANCFATFCDTVGMDSSGNLKSAGFGLEVRNPIAVGLEEEKEKTAISIFPNPANDNVSIDLRLGSNVYNVRILDISGRVIAERNNTPSGNIETFDVSELNNGFYFFLLDDGSSQMIEKFIVSN